MSSDFEERLEKFQKIISNADKICFLGGAGVSVASGIPDFRSANGLYNKRDPEYANYPPEYLLSNRCLFDNPKLFFKFYRDKLDCRSVEPNITHLKLAELERAGKITGIITQNIDGLHQKAGSRKVYEVHGTTLVNRCTKCGKEYPPDYIFESKEPVPHCKCGGVIRPDVVLYGELLPDDAVDHAYEAMENSEVLIIAGTSLSVPPVAHMPKYFNGSHMIICNQQETYADPFADLIFREDMTEVFSMLVV